MKKRSGLYELTGEDLNNLTKFGIYIITNNINHYVYVGSTTRDFYSRWIEHYNDLKNNRHHCLHLQNFVNKYSISSITFSVIEVINNIETCQDREKFWIDFYGFKNCFNTAKETNLQISGETHPSFKKIDVSSVLELYGNGMNTSELARVFGVSTSKIKTTLYKSGIKHIRRTNIINIEEAIEKHKGGNSWLSIARYYGVDKFTLRNAIRKYEKEKYNVC